MNRKLTFKNFFMSYFPILMFALICLLAVLGCEQLTDTDTSDSGDRALPGLAVINEIDSTSDITQNSITISWTAPTVSGTEATITGYKVYYKEGDTVTVSDGTLLNATTDEGLLTAATITISNLTPGTQYAFMIVTINSLGKHSTSVVVKATTVSVATKPNEITAFTPVAKNDSITLSWVAPDPGTNANGTPATITGYKIYFGQGTNILMNETYLLNKDQNGGLQTATSVTISGLIEATQYIFVVVTYATSGLSSYTHTVSYTVAAYTKLGANGQPLTKQDGTWSNDGTETDGTKWSCVLSKRGTNETYWEVKTNEGVRDKDNTYRWGGLTAIGRDNSPQDGEYFDDWDTLVNEANDTANNGADALCGFDNWRVPSLDELKTILKYDDIKMNDGVYINTNYFPNTQANKYWVVNTYTNTNFSSSVIDFRTSSASRGYSRSKYAYVRLVRNAP